MLANSNAKGIFARPPTKARVKPRRLKINGGNLPDFDLNAVIDNLSQGIRIIGKDYTVLHINRAFSELSGISPDQAKGKKCWEIFKSPFCHTTECRLKRILAEDRVIQVEIERTKPDGTVIPCQVSAFPLKTCDCELTGIMESFRDITESRLLLARARESEEMYRALIELGSEVGEAIVMLQDIDGIEAVQVYVSDHWLKITGYSREEILGQSFIDLIQPEERMAVTRRYRERMAGKIMPGLFEMNIKSKSGELIPIEYTAALSIYHGRSADVVYLRNISERKQIEKDMRESEERAQALIHLGTESNEAIIMLEDKDGREGVHAFVSDQWLKITGYSRNELLGMAFTDLLCRDDREASVVRHRLKMSGQTVPGLFEMNIIRKNGVRVPIELTGAFTKYHGKQVTVNYIRDITQRRDAEQKLKQIENQIRESEERYRSLFEDVPIAIYELDYTEIKHRIDYLRSLGVTDFGQFFTDNRDEFLYCFSLRKVIGFNKAVVATLGADSREEVITGIQHHLENRPTGLSRDMANLVALTNGKTRISYKSSEKNFKGKWHTLSIDFVVAPGHENDWSRIFILFLDITEQEKAQNELKLYKDKLEQEVNERTKQLRCEIDQRKAAEDKIQTLYASEKKLRQELEALIKRRAEYTRALVHELKTPLTPMVAASEAISNHLNEEPLKSLALRLNRGALNLSERVDELMDLARGEIGILKISCSMVKPDLLLYEIFDYCRLEAEKFGLSLSLDIGHGIPTVRMDRGRIRQVILNLLDNSFKFTPSGGNVVLSLIEKGKELVFSVSDNGIGMTKDECKRCFEPYDRVSRDRERLSGLGLGLALSKSIIDLHKGKIFATSNKGKGTTINFSIPLNEGLENKEVVTV